MYMRRCARARVRYTMASLTHPDQSLDLVALSLFSLDRFAFGGVRRELARCVTRVHNLIHTIVRVRACVCAVRILSSFSELKNDVYLESLVEEPVTVTAYLSLV